MRLRAVRRRASAGSAVALTAALLAGCGSTVSTASGPAAATLDGGLSVPGPVPGSAGGRDAPVLSSTGGTRTAPAVPSPAAPGPAGAAAAPGDPTTAPHAHLGTTAAGRLVLKLGVVYLKGLDQAYKAANGGKSATTDSQADYAAVVKSLNARPGAHVVIQPSYYAVDASSAQSQADQLEAACAQFTSDVHVDIVASYSPGAEGALAKCLQNHGVPLIDGAAAAYVGESVEGAVPDLWQPSQLTLDRVGTLQATYLVRDHWVDKRWPSAARCSGVSQPRIGVVTFDRPDWRAAYEHAVVPTFKSLGHPVYDAEFLAVSGSTAEQLAQASSGAQNAVLKFSSECIDHVAFVGNVALDYLFMNVAQQQGYHPRYGLSSLEAPPVIVQNLAQPTQQLHGAIGPGWSPYSDVDLSHLDAMSKAPAAGCLTILAKAGHAPTDNNSTILALPSCEGPMFALAVVQRWLTTGRTGSLLDVVNSMGSAYRPVGTFSARIDASHHDGANAYRGFAYVDSCTCFRYVSGLQRIG